MNCGMRHQTEYYNSTIVIGFLQIYDYNIDWITVIIIKTETQTLQVWFLVFLKIEDKFD